ncbi:outer membrane protein assembly factor BamB [Uliginosibacterium sp. sgz301328]|uniref:outer membrane protein assembly factor BamB n=1 Tax=Uliginosibacterium sp. sgz301328 TaxID=3243764 RepID=UPI00359D63D7
MRALRSAILFAAVVPMLSGCFLWSKSDKGPQPTPLVAFQQSADLRTVWRNNVGDLEDTLLRPAVSGTSVFAAAQNGNIVRIDNGQESWRIRAPSKLVSGVGSDGKVVVAGSATGQLFAFGADKGDLLWRIPLAGELTSEPLVADGLVVVRVGDNQLLAYDTKDGKRRWVYQRAQAPLSLRTHTGLTRLDDAVLAGFPGGKLVALSAGSGFPRWEASITQPKGSNELERMVDVVGNPAISGESACVASFQGRVGCVVARSGVLQWTRDIPSVSGVSADDRFVYVTDESGAVYALDVRTGASAWKQDKLMYRGVGRPLAIGNQFVAVSDQQGWIHVLDRTDGHFVARTQLDSSGIFAPLVKYADSFVAQTKNGAVFMLSVR